jgi:microcin C transport system substrate-binding protein
MVKKLYCKKPAILVFALSTFCSTVIADTHGVSTFRQLKYPSNFSHFDYVNPKAPKGGTLHIGALGTFDSLNSYIIKGKAAAGAVMMHATLLDEAKDVSGESYAYVAESVEVAPDRSWVIFTINPKAQFNTGEKITVDDVIWSFETIRTKGLPLFRTYYKNIEKAEKLDDHRVKFTFNTTRNRELPGILGQLPIFSKKYYETVSFDETSLAPSPASGPYEIEEIIPGRSIIYKRVKNWWGENIPSQHGLHNFDRIRVDYYLDSNSIFEGFKAGQIDLRTENTAKFWVTGYDFPAFKKGFVKKEEISYGLSSGTSGFFFNTRRPLLQDLRVRKAITLAFDFNWCNKNLFYGLYKRNLSYFPRSDFAMTGKPDGAVLKALEPYKDKLAPSVLETTFSLPDMATESEKRDALKEATSLLEEVGWKKDTEIELLLSDKSTEKIALNFQQNLARIGVKLKVRTVDTASYQERLENFDYDMVFELIPQSGSLGNEQRDYFGSERADTPGTRNYAGIKNPIVDALIEKLIQSETYEDLVSNARALDTVLLWTYSLIPAWHSPVARLAFWDKFGRPEIAPKLSPVYWESWWYDEEKASKIEQKSDKSQSSDSEKKPSWFKRLYQMLTGK